MIGGGRLVVRLSQLVADFNSSWVQISGDPFFSLSYFGIRYPFFLFDTLGHRRHFCFTFTSEREREIVLLELLCRCKPNGLAEAVTRSATRR